MSDEKTATEIVDEMILRAALEPFMKVDPATLSDDQLLAMIEHHRELRTLFINKERSK